MTELLLNGKLNFVKGQRVRMRALVTVPELSLAAIGGLAFAAKTISDAGFDEVRVSSVIPAGWAPRARSTPVTFPDWLLWIEALPRSSTTMSVALVEGATVTDAWEVSEATPTVTPGGAPSNPATTPPAAPQGGPSSPAALVGLVVGTVGIGALLTWVLLEERRRRAVDRRDHD